MLRVLDLSLQHIMISVISCNSLLTLLSWVFPDLERKHVCQDSHLGTLVHKCKSNYKYNFIVYSISNIIIKTNFGATKIFV